METWFPHMYRSLHNLDTVLQCFMALRVCFCLKNVPWFIQWKVCQTPFAANSKYQLICYSSQEKNILEQENLNSHIPLSHDSKQHHLITHEVMEGCRTLLEMQGSFRKKQKGQLSGSWSSCLKDGQRPCKVRLMVPPVTSYSFPSKCHKYNIATASNRL